MSFGAKDSDDVGRRTFGTDLLAMGSSRHEPRTEPTWDETVNLSIRIASE